jgi:hypothetical protein
VLVIDFVVKDHSSRLGNYLVSIEAATLRGKLLKIRFSRLFTIAAKMSVEKICILKNLRIGEAKELPDIVVQGNGKKTIGRNTETMIESSSVSREHRELIRDLEVMRNFS